VLRHEVSTAPGTQTLDVIPKIDEQGSWLFYAAGVTYLEPFSDGTFVKLRDSSSPFHREAREFLEGGANSLMMVGLDGRSWVHLVELSTGMERAVRLPRGYSHPRLAGATGDGRYVFLTAPAQFERPHRSARDLLVYDPESDSLRVLTWSPPPWVRFESAIVWGILLVLLLLGLAAWMILFDSGRRPMTTFNLAVAGILVAVAAVIRVAGRGQAWTFLAALAVVVLVACVAAAKLGPLRGTLARWSQR
jgi:hypothetical protein